MTDSSNTPKNIVLIGAGGHAGVIVDCIQSAGLPVPIAIVDGNPALTGTTAFGIPVQGTDSDLERLILELHLDGFVMGIGSVGDASIRATVFRNAIARLRNPLSVIHPTAVISNSATLGAGVQIFPTAVVNTNAVIGQNVIINSGAIVEHDCNVGDHCHVAPGAIVAGSVTIGSGSHIGAGATVLQSVSIGPNAVVGAGAVVTDDVQEDQVVVGVPARTIQRRQVA